MRRITVDEVRAACEATGYRLVQGITLNPERKCGCPLGVLSIHETGRPKLSGHPSMTLCLDNSYCAGVMNGFDDYFPDVSGNENYYTGFADGTAIRTALLSPA